MSTTQAKETLDIPAKPAAVTAANVAILTGIGVAATGPVGAAVAVTTAALATVAVKGKKKAAAKAALRSTTPSGGRRSTGASSRGASSGRARTGLLSKLTGGRRGAAAGTAAKGASKAGGAAASKAGAGKTGTGRTSPLSRLARAIKPSRGGSSSAPKTSSGSTPKGPVSRTASKAGRVASRAAKWAMPKAGRAIKNAVTAGSSKRKSEGRSGTANQSGGKWKKARDFFQSRILGRKKKEDGKKPEEKVGTKVDRRNRPAGSTETVVTRGRVIIRRSGKAVPIAGAPSCKPAITGGNAMRNHAAQLFVSAGEFTPRGLLDITNEVYDLQDVLAYVAGAVGTIVQKSKKGWPLHEDVVAKIGLMVEDLYAAAEKAKELPQMVEDCHKDDLARFRNPRAGEEMADYAVNAGRG